MTHQELKSQLDNLQQKVANTEYWLTQIITTDPKLAKIKRLAWALSSRQNPVFIIGETGTGKELVARSLHGQRTGEFIAVNCNAIPTELFETEFFGCRKGAYTGAHEHRKGYLEASSGGTLFLDEITEMAYHHQAKLLRCIQGGTFRRVGESHERHFYTRFVAATNRVSNYQDYIRPDLFYRLAEIELLIPPLRNRPYKDFFEILEKHCTNQAVKSKIQKLIEDDYRWPGNVRELVQKIRSYELMLELGELD